MKRWAAALRPLAVVCLLAACSSSSTAGTSATSAGPFASQAERELVDRAGALLASVVTLDRM
jgi:hypothetical protein